MADTPRTLSVSVEHELTKSYLDYAMSVIVGRALPDCRDGLKPVHRRILYAMHELGNTASKPYKKSARIVGDVHGKYHPHGESAIYDSIVRLAQSFSMRYTLIDGQGNFGSVDGDMAAAARYTEIRMTPLTQQLLLTDLDKETVNFTPNYDGSEMIPDVLPAAFPNFLVNGSAGIAVGMATQTPPHNLGEVLDAFIYYIDHPDCTTADLMQYLPGPDFPTRGQILGTQGIYQAYQTGKGRVVLRGTHHLEHPTEDRTTIVITEIPYQVNKAKLVEKIAELAREKTIEGIAALRDESDKEGMRIALELKRDGNAELILNQLYQLTQLQSSFSINMVGLANGRPQLLTLLKIFEYFLQHRLDVITRRVRYEFQKARNKVHLLEGLAVALSHIDEIIALIQNSNTAKDAKEALCERRWHAPSLEEWLDNSLREALLLPQNLPYGLSDSHYQLSQKQADTILEMRLHKLTALEKDELKNDYRKILKDVSDLRLILESADKRLDIVRAESRAIRAEYNDPRCSRIDHTESDFIDNEDLIPREQLMITLSHAGYIKTQPLSYFEEQRRGGKGRTAGKFKAEDSLNKILVAHSHDTLFCFSSAGKVYAIRVFELPNGSRYSSGRPIVNCISLGEGETISAMLAVSNWDGFVFMTTRHGVVKKVALNLFKNTRSSGIIAIALDDNDCLDHVFLTNGQNDIMLFNTNGKAIRFDEEEVRPTGRNSRGIRGMTLKEGATIVSAIGLDRSIQDAQLLLTASLHGYGKCTPVDQYRVQSRGGMGVIAMNDSPRNGQLIGAILAHPGDHLLFLTEQGRSLRTPLENIALRSRNTQGVRLVKIGDTDRLCRLERIDKQFVTINDESDLEENTLQAADLDIEKDDTISEQESSD